MITGLQKEKQQQEITTKDKEALETLIGNHLKNMKQLS
jgi:hypothetical protein